MEGGTGRSPDIEMKEIQSVAIVGLGAIGSTVVPYLSKALKRENLKIIAGGARADRLRKNGIVINGKHYDLNVVSPEEKTPSDLIILSVKNHALPQAIEDMKNQVGENTLILSLMNGISSEADLAEAYGEEKVIYGLTMVNAKYKDGVASFEDNGKGIRFGEQHNQLSDLTPRVAAVKALFDAAEMTYDIPEDMIRELWMKFLINVSANTVSGVLRARHEVFQKLEAPNEARMCVMREVVELSKAMGTGLTDADAENLRYIHKGYDPNGQGSLLQDILAGRPTENDMFCGTVMRLGAQYGVPTPVNTFLYALIKSIDDARAAGIQ
ncbi:MAG: 2-dehydropantoate 2-reductase [Clostridiales bacterium]|nr:2-dehydropantoate 2-reductase [Clostridiales bacterium]